MRIASPPEANVLRAELEAVGPSLSLVSGLRGVGKTHLLRTLTSSDPAAVYYRALSLPDPDHRALLATSLEGWAGGEVQLRGLDWGELVKALSHEVAATRRRLVLVLDDAHRLVESRSRLPGLLSDAWGGIRARSLPVHLVLAGRTPALESTLGAPDGPLAPLLTRQLQVQPLDFRVVGDQVRDRPAIDRLRTWGVFGGRPHRLRHLDPRVSLATNIQRLVLDPEGPLFTDGGDELEEATSSAPRYTGLLRAMAGGAAEWGTIMEATSEVESGGQMAPYLARLEELGLVRGDRSLDAGPRSRRRRYRIADPFLAFWHHLVLPHVSEIEMGRGGEVWSRHVRPGLAAHMARWLPLLARTWLARYADERLPSLAREVGGLWGRGYDLDPAGTLRTGAVVYGATRWSDAPADESHDDDVAAQLRATRYGFGREARLRLLVSVTGTSPGLVRRAARDPLLHLVGPADLLGH